MTPPVILACIVRAVGTVSVLAGLFAEELELEAAVGVEVGVADVGDDDDVIEGRVKLSLSLSPEWGLGGPVPPTVRSETVELILEFVTTSILCDVSSPCCLSLFSRLSDASVPSRAADRMETEGGAGRAGTLNVGGSFATLGILLLEGGRGPEGPGPSAGL